MAALDAGKLGRAPGAETGSRGGGRRLVCEAHGREESQQRAQASGEAARLGAVVAVARRRPSSACVQGDGVAWRGREASGGQRRGATRARRVAGGLDSDDDHGSASTEQRREREERVRD